MPIRSVLKRLILTACAAVAGLFAVLAIWLAWQAVRDPMAALPTDGGPLRVIEETVEPPSTGNGTRQRRLVVLSSEALGSISIKLSLPDPLPPKPMRAAIILGGLRTGKDSVEKVPEPGPNVLVGYDYPFERGLKGAAVIGKLPALYDGVYRVPGQIAALVGWLRSQPWVDPDRVSLLGFSLGALFVPVVHRVASAQDQSLGPTIIAFGGADLATLAAAQSKAGPQWVRRIFGEVVALALRPLEPSVHLPHLNGVFLVIAASDDDSIPRKSTLLLRELLPEPKTVVLIESSHVGSLQPQLIHQIITLSRDWLSARGAVD